MRLTLTLLRHTLTLALEPDDEESAAEREGSADAYVERAPDDRSRNAEMDGRPFGFRGAP